jgi:hypothetical protein
MGGTRKDPRAPFERWLNRDQFTIRRKVRLTNVGRDFKPKPYGIYDVLRKLKFQAAHSWPLNWGETGGQGSGLLGP